MEAMNAELQKPGWAEAGPLLHLDIHRESCLWYRPLQVHGISSARPRRRQAGPVMCPECSHPVRRNLTGELAVGSLQRIGTA